MTVVVEFDAHKVRNYLDQSLNLFMNDPPKSDYQQGFLAAVLAVWEEALGRADDGRVAVLQARLSE